ncbi:Cysteine and glycine-rich protein 3 [Coemansia erecta]|uniref:Cysteine and glycine-rich protein 3 n=1 Tax=Coemansia asiatica TaxID=1052880 RepID=A0A9W8CLQ8_9FUNG|nr:Cysteine and glycine-rich protein 3 [Coemansia asiatica]KAJ2856957.1 Cysteine and glycine-rich protein 3 [Coemansia erecta]
MVVIYGGAPKCPRCSKSVYAAEGVNGPEGQWHRKCFKCLECSRSLDMSTMAEHEKEVYCRSCHKRLFGAGAAKPTAAAASRPAVSPAVGRYVVQNSTSSAVNARSAPEYAHRDINVAAEPPTLPQRNTAAAAAAAASPAPQTPPRQTGAAYARSGEISPSSVFSSGRRRVSIPATRDMCPRCAKPIYHAEKVVGPGGPWHRGCFKCKQCNCALSSTILTEHDGEAFCRTCYTKLFSLRGYNVGGSLEPSPQRQQQQQQQQLPRSRGSSFETIPPPVVGSSYQRSSGSSPTHRSTDNAAASVPRTPTSPLDSSPFVSAAAAAASAAVAAHGNRPATPLSAGSMVSRPVSSRNLSPGMPYGRTYKPKVFGAGMVPPDICPRCNKTIYHAEQGIAAGRKYHKSCIRCKSCNVSIGSLQITEHDGEIFCKQCYARDFGPKGFRQSLGPSINDF